jgi:hypothetical protein
MFMELRKAYRDEMLDLDLKCLSKKALLPACSATERWWNL